MKRDRPKQAKLNPDIVRAIRENRHGKTYRQQASDFGVAWPTIRDVRQYRTWRRV